MTLPIMDPLDVAGDAEAIGGIVEDVIESLEARITEGSTSNKTVAKLVADLSDLRQVLENVSTEIDEADSLSSEQLVTDCAEIWECLHNAIKRYGEIIATFRNKLRRSRSQFSSDESSMSSSTTTLASLRSPEVKNNRFQAEAHTVIIKLAMLLLLLAATSISSPKKTDTLGHLKAERKHQLIQAKNVLTTIAFDDGVIEPTLQHAMNDLQALRDFAKRPLSNSSLSAASPSGSPTLTQRPQVSERTSSTTNTLNSFPQTPRLSENAHSSTSTPQRRDRRRSTSTGSSSVVNWTTWDQSRPIFVESRENNSWRQTNGTEAPHNESWVQSPLEHSSAEITPLHQTESTRASRRTSRIASAASSNEIPSTNRTSMTTARNTNLPIVPKLNILQLKNHNYITHYTSVKLLDLTMFPTSDSKLIIELTTGLRWACRGEDPVAMKLLLSLGADPNTASDTVSNMSLLVETITKRSVAVVETLLDGGANINARTTGAPFGNRGSPLNKSTIEGDLSPLSHAVLSGRAEMVDLLLSKSAEVDFHAGDKGLPPIFLAALTGRGTLTEKLLAVDSSPLTQTLKFDIELNVAHVAAWYGQVAVLEALQGDPRWENIFERQSSIFFEGYWGLADKQEWKYDEPPDRGTALHAAVIGKENVHTITFLLKHGLVPVDATDAQGRTALHLGVTYFRQSSWMTIVKLLQYHANPNTCDGSGMTPLHTLLAHSAEHERDVPVLKRLAADLLGSQGVDPHSTDSQGRTPMDLRKQKFPGSFAKTRFESVKSKLAEDRQQKYNRKFTKELEEIFKKIPANATSGNHTHR